MMVHHFVEQKLVKKWLQDNGTEVLGNSFNLKLIENVWNKIENMVSEWAGHEGMSHKDLVHCRLGIFLISLVTVSTLRNMLLAKGNMTKY